MTGLPDFRHSAPAPRHSAHVPPTAVPVRLSPERCSPHRIPECGTRQGGPCGSPRPRVPGRRGSLPRRSRRKAGRGGAGRAAGARGPRGPREQKQGPSPLRSPYQTQSSSQGREGPFSSIEVNQHGPMEARLGTPREAVQGDRATWLRGFVTLNFRERTPGSR